MFANKKISNHYLLTFSKMRFSYSSKSSFFVLVWYFCSSIHITDHDTFSWFMGVSGTLWPILLLCYTLGVCVFLPEFLEAADIPR